MTPGRKEINQRIILAVVQGMAKYLSIDIQQLKFANINHLARGQHVSVLPPDQTDKERHVDSC